MKRVAMPFLVLALFVCLACGDDSTTTQDVLMDVAGDLGTDNVVPEDTGTDTRPDPGIDMGQDLGMDVCTPDCDGKECGDDGCGNSCGACTGVGESCNEQGMCEACINPTTWGALGRVITGEFPDATESETLCPDFSGDSVGDNAVAAFAAQLNPMLQEEITKGYYGAVAEFLAVADWTDQAAFTFNAFAAGTEVPGSSELWANPLWFNPETCMPWVHATDAKLEAGVLTVPAQDYYAAGTWREIALAGTVKMAQVTGTVTHTEAGITLTDGVLAGVITAADIEALITTVTARCEATEPPEWCEDIGLLELVPGAYDLDLNEDEENDAMSICVKFTMEPATILGYGIE